MPQVCFFSRALDNILFFYKILMLNDSNVRIKETVCYDTLYYNDSVSSFFIIRIVNVIFLQHTI